MSSASLSLLKGAAPAAAEPEEEQVAIDVKSMTEDQIDDLVMEYEVPVPNDWQELDRDQKIAVLESMFESTGEETSGEETVDVETTHDETQEEPAQPAKKAAAKKEPAKKATKAKASAKSKADAAAGETKEAQAEETTELAPSAIKHGEVMDKDELEELIFEIENMKEQAARQAIPTLTNHTELSMFKLGGVMALIQSKGWYAPYASFREYIEKEHDMKYRKALYWIEIYNALVNAKVSWAKVKGIGWSKLKEIARVITEDNQDQWIEMAKGHTVADLEAVIKKHLTQKKLADNPDNEGGSGEVMTITTKTFKLHEGQREVVEGALEKAMEEAGTDVATLALEAICSDYLAKPTLAERIKTAGYEKVLEMVVELFPQLDISVSMAEED